MAKTLFADGSIVQGSIKAAGRSSGKPFTAALRVVLDDDEHADALRAMDPAVSAFLDSLGTSKLELNGVWERQCLAFFPYIEGPNRTNALPEPDCTAHGAIDKVKITKKDSQVIVTFTLTLIDSPIPEESDGTAVELDLLARKNLPKHIRNTLSE